MVTLNINCLVLSHHCLNTEAHTILNVSDNKYQKHNLLIFPNCYMCVDTVQSVLCHCFLK